MKNKKKVIEHIELLKRNVKNHKDDMIIILGKTPSDIMRGLSLI